MKPFGFGKPERLKSRKQIDTLFAEGKSVTTFPVRVKYQFVRLTKGAVPVLAGVSASRKAFKRAVDRNRIKRLLREAYRLQKSDFVKAVAEKNIQARLFLLYTDKAMASFEIVYEAVGACLRQLHQKANAYHENRH